MKKSTETLAESSIILILSTALVKIISAFFKIPLANDLFLGETGFGYFSVAHDLYMPFYLLAMNGMPISVSYIISEKVTKNAQKEALESFFVFKRLFTRLGLICCLAFILATVPFFLFSSTNVESYYSIFAIIPSIFLCFLISAYRGYFEGFSNMYPTAFSRVIEALSKALLGLLFSYFTLKMTNNVALASVSAIIAITFGTFMSLMYLVLNFKRQNPINDSYISKNNKINLKPFFIAALPFVIAGISASFVALLDVFTVKLPLDYADKSYFDTVILQNKGINGDISSYLYGVRSKAFTIYNLIPTITSALGVGALPVLTGLSIKKQYNELKNDINYSLKLISVITLPASLGIISLSRGIMSLLYSSNDILGENLLKIYGFTALFSGFSIPMITILLAIGKKKITILNILLSIIIKIITALIMVSYSKINIYSAAYSSLLCYLYLFLAIMIVLIKEIGNISFINSFLKPFVSSALCAITAFLISLISDDKIYIVLAVVGAVTVYFFMIFITKTFSKSEISRLSIINKLKIK